MNKQQLCVVQAELMKLTPHRWDKGLTITMKLQLCDHLDAYVSTNLISYIWGHPSKVRIWLHLGPGVSSHFFIWNSIGFEIHLDFWDTVFCMPQHFLIYFTVDFQLVGFGRPIHFSPSSYKWPEQSCFFPILISKNGQVIDWSQQIWHYIRSCPIEAICCHLCSFHTFLLSIEEIFLLWRNSLCLQPAIRNLPLIWSDSIFIFFVSNIHF